MVKLAAVLSILVGLGFGLPCAYGIWYFSTRGEVWTFLGVPTYGEGPFEAIGIQTTVLLLAAFLVVCWLEVVMGWLLWRGLRAEALPEEMSLCKYSRSCSLSSRRYSFS